VSAPASLPQPEAAAQHRLAGIALGLAGVALLAALDGVGKHLLRYEDALTVTWVRHLSALPFALLIWWGAGRPPVRADMWRPHVLRGVVIAVTSLSFFAALALLPLAEVVLLVFVAPLLMPFVAWAMLGERVRGLSLVALGLGFAGVVVTGAGAFDPASGTPDRQLAGIALALLAALTYALAMVMLRQRASRDGAALVGVFAVAVPGALLTAPLLVAGSWPQAGLAGWYLLFGACGAGAMWCLARAYALAQAQVLAPLEYSALIWAGLIGWLVFAEVPRAGLWLAAPLILAACALTALGQARAPASGPGTAAGGAA
jgi:S-adenosylmethionine uptake transporter